MNKDDIHDIHGPLPLPEPVNWWIIAGMLLGTAILVALVVVLWKKRRSREATVIVAPHTRALAELAEARQYMEQGQSLDYAERVSDIVRQYIEQRFSLPTTRQTTREFFGSLQALQEDVSSSGSVNIGVHIEPYRKALQHCLEQCDLAKYAHKTAGSEEMAHIEENVRLFIESTLVEEEQ
ncbi:MAG: DUF4381 domain-containing protein [Desulfopila sp.]